MNWLKTNMKKFLALLAMLGLGTGLIVTLNEQGCNISLTKDIPDASVPDDSVKEESESQ